MKLVSFLAACALLAAAAGTAVAETIALSAGNPAWAFDDGSREFSVGAGGGLTRGNGVLRLDGDFAFGGRYAAVALAMDYPDAEEFRFRVRTAASRIAVRFEDAAGRIHEHSAKLSGSDADFQEVGFPVAASAQNGGEPFAPPLKSIRILIHANGFRTDAGFAEIRDVRLTGVSGAKGVIACRAASPEEHFVTPGDAAPFRLSVLAGKEQFSPEELRYRCLDYSGNETASGTASFDAKERILSVPSPQKPGYYDLEFPALGIRSAVVAGEPYTGVAEEYFAMDFSLNGRKRFDTAAFGGFLRVLARNGIGWGRDRFAWGELHPEPGRFDFDGRGERSETLHRLAGEAGISIFDTFREAPAWNRRLRTDRDAEGSETGHYSYGCNVFPRNLIDAARSLAVVASRWSSGKALAVWDAPDAGFGNGFPAEFVTALTKAVSTRFSLDKVPVLLVGGGLAGIRGEDDMLYRAYVSGGLLDDVDAVSLQSGEEISEIEYRVAGLRATERARKNNRAGIPYWITGSGGSWTDESGTGRPEAGTDRRIAAQLVARAIEFRALGAEKFFPFTGKDDRGGERNFGMLDRNDAPLRSMAAYAYLPRALAHREYVGDLKIGGVMRSRVFTDGRDAVACLYAGGERSPLKLPEGLEILKAAGADGRTLEVRDGLVPMDDGIVYLYCDTFGLLPYLEVETPAMELYRLARGFKPAARAAKPVVIQPGYELDGMLYDRFGYRVKNGETVLFKVFFNNLSDKEVTVEPYLNLPAGIRYIEEKKPEEEKDAKKKAERLKLDILPGTLAEYVFRVRFDPSLDRREYTTFSVADRNSNATPLVIAVKPYQVERIALSPGAGPTDWIDFSRPADWKSERIPSVGPDIRAKFRASARKGGLRLEVQVLDETQECDFPAAEAWRGDSVQIALQLRRSAGDFSAPVQAFCAARSREGEKMVRQAPGGGSGPAEGAALAFSRNDGVSSYYVIDIPASALGVPALEKGMMFGISLKVNSAAADGRSGSLSWGDFRNPALFQQLEF